MKKSIKICVLFVLLITIGSAFKSIVINPELEIGAKTPMTDTKMMDVSGKDVSLSTVKGENGLLVIFSCNTCPYVKLSESRIKEVSAHAKRNSIGLILVNSNEAQRSNEDSFEAMKKYAAEQEYDFSYVVDKNSVLANAFGATRTPHCFLFDKNDALVYRGAIDDNIKDQNAVKENFLVNAIIATAAGRSLKTNSTKSVGCSIKRME